ncbi:MAG: hypothetical protein E7578_07995 [Ruminococcaceae bacterium]|nr:hypothetical protein [Oscillospiraceae bacterium]
MESKRNLKYFTTHGIHPITIVGLILTVVGVAFIPIFAGTDFSTMVYVGIGLAVVGLVLLYIINGGKATPDDLDYVIYEKVKYLDETAQKRHEVYESKFRKDIKPVTLKGYDYSEQENLYFKKGSDHKNRTNVYNTAVLYFTKDRMYIYGRHFSLTDELFDKEIMSKHKFVDLGKAEIIDGEATFTIGNYTNHITTHTFRITKANGDVILSMTVDYGADMDKAVDDINRVIAVTKDEVARLAAEQK